MSKSNRNRVYHIMKFWHPDAEKDSEFVEEVKTRREAQKICSGPGSSFSVGDTKNHFFLGFVGVEAEEKG